ncbi:MAG TPA: aldo/keto reductase [Jiangellaceae bacterium]|jgi:aryl-alcohol dehydrogenase-like predicted oxidoreductase|nr:aldo/keto reductase [Jiangellaceae bacterium]
MSSSLPTVAFGRTDMRVSRVGFGAWAIGGVGWPDAWGAQDDAVSVAAIHRAVERGVNWIDTAPIYGHGHSEQVVARALRGLSEGDRPYVFTKAGLRWNPDEPMSPPALVGSPENIRAEVEASLRRLGVDRIDLLQMHWPPTDGTPIEEYWPAFLDLRDQGKVRAVGLSNHDVPLLEAAEALGHVDSLQPKFSAVYRDAAADVLPWCADHDTAAIVYSPMVSGLLTGTLSAGNVAALPPDDWRSHHPDFAEPALSRHLALADGLRPVANRHAVPVAAVAVAWTLAFRGVTGAIVGARRPEQIDGWLAAGSLALDEDDLDEIAVAIKKTGAGSGPAHPTVGRARG